MQNIAYALDLATRVKSKAMSHGQQLTAATASKVERELQGLNNNSYLTKQYLANVVPKLQQLNTMLSY